MNLEMASLVAGSETPAGDGITGAQRCIITLAGGVQQVAVLKRGPIGQIVAEAFAALLLRGWGLPVPKPYLVDDNGALAFAGADDGYPNLKQNLGISALPQGPAQEAATMAAINLVCGLTNTTLAVACDEAIDNRDRNLGNILWDGSTDTWIDHAFSLGEGSHLPDENKLCSMANAIGRHEEICRGATAHSLMLSRTIPSEINDVLRSSNLPSDQKTAYIIERLNSLGRRVLSRFPRPADLLSQT